MAITYGFFNSLNGDRVYDAVQVSSMLDGVISDGVFVTVGLGLAVRDGTGMNIIVGSGKAWFDHTWTNNDSDLIIAIDAAEVVLNRIDTVILEVDSGDVVRANSIKILKGTPASTPVAATLTNTSTKHQYALAFIAVNAQVTEITGAMVTNNIGTVDTPFVTGVLDSVNLDEYYVRWESEMDAIQADAQTDFDVWFAAMQGQLTTDAAGNLQTQINAINSEVDSGWNLAGNTWSYSSVDSPTGIISIVDDMTSKLERGMRVSYQQSQALTGYWTFDSSSAATVGSFTMANIATPTYTAGKFSNGLTLNGTTQALSITDVATLKPTGEFTFGCWIKSPAPSTTPNNQTVFQSFSQNTALAGFLIRLDHTTGFVNVFLGKNTGTVYGQDYYQLTSKISCADNSWHYIQFVFRNNFGQLYIDGNLEESGYMLAPVYAATNYIRIGCQNVTGTNAMFFNGQIDDLFFINGYAMDEVFFNKKFKQNTAQGTAAISATKMGLITNVGPYSAGNTLITVYHGTDYMLVNSTITNPKFSSEKVPFDFPAKIIKWQIILEDFINRTQSNPVNGTWYNIGNLSLIKPIGHFAVNIQIPVQAVSTASQTAVNVWSTLSTLSTGETMPKLITLGRIGGASGTHTLQTIISKTGFIQQFQKTTLYVLLKTTTANSSIDIYSGAITPLSITLSSLYL